MAVLGIDIGSVTLKLALLDQHRCCTYFCYEKHCGQVIDALRTALAELIRQTSQACVTAAAVTGSGRELISELLAISAVNEIVAQASAAHNLCPATRTIIEIGGQDCKYIELAQPTNSTEPVILTQRLNDICAAGTGAFLEQQASRLGVTIDQFVELALEAEAPAAVACRCAVFCKTDIAHLRQQGAGIAEIAAGLCTSLAKSYGAQFIKGRKPACPIVFQGGLAANAAVVEAFRRVLNLSSNELLVPASCRVTGAIGAALKASPPKGSGDLQCFIDALRPSRASAERKTCRRRLARLESRGAKCPAQSAAVTCLGAADNIYLGIDAGSTSTCVAAIDQDGGLAARSYVLQTGLLIDSLKAALREVNEQLRQQSWRGLVAGVAATGSGRQLIAQFIGADLIKEEISAQAAGAAYLVPRVDTIIEIGGQDSKYIRLSQGQVAEFEMNRVCAAGTGSFLKEQAERLGSDLSALSALAFNSISPVDLGSRCTVFIESDMVSCQQAGIPREDLAAGLSYSLARNYLEKVAAGKHFGDCVVFLGGVARNSSVVAAFERLIDQEIEVPAHHDISAAIGAALLVRAEMTAAPKKTAFRGFDCQERQYEHSSFQCSDCENMCRINRVVVNRQEFCYNGICGKHEEKRQQRPTADYFAQREELLLHGGFRTTPAGTPLIGVPRSQLFFEYFPMWRTYLETLGYEVVVSGPTNESIISEALERSSIDNCFASKVMYGHVANLLHKGVRRIFLPAVIEFERQLADFERNYSCPHVQAMASLIRTAFAQTEVISPVFVRRRSDHDWMSQLKRFAGSLGASPELAEKAVHNARTAHEEFRMKREQLGRELLTSAQQPTCVLLGKIYNVCDPALNLKAARKLRERGMTVLPYDCLPLSEQPLPGNFRDMVWQSGQEMLRAAKIIVASTNLYPVMITNFGCGPDSFIVKFLNELFVDRPFLVLEVDEHASDVGMTTRIEAFLNNIRSTRPAKFPVLAEGFRPYVPQRSHRRFDRLLYVPVGFDSYRAIAAAFETVGIRTKLLPAHDEETMRLGRRHTSGSECLPYIMHAGDAVRMTHDEEFHPERSALYLPASDLGCRVSLFTTSIRFVLRNLGYPELPVIAPRVSMDKDEALSMFGIRFVRTLLRGMLSLELLSRLLTQKRPYEKNTGEADRLYQEGVDVICSSLAQADFYNELSGVLQRFDCIPTVSDHSRPVLGLIGDDYTRGNDFANGNLIKTVEALGGVVWNVPIWSSFLEFQLGMKPRRMQESRRYLEYSVDTVKAYIGRRDLRRISAMFAGRIEGLPDPCFDDILAFAGEHLDKKTEPLALIALSHINHLLSRQVDGLINLVGFQCMIHSIVMASMKPIVDRHGGAPVLTLSLDFQQTVHLKNRLEAFLYQVKQHRALRKDSANNAAGQELRGV